jgi:hypothetical protein
VENRERSTVFVSAAIKFLGCSADAQSMERRKYRRFKTDERATITLLDPSARVLVGKLRDFSERGFRVEISEELRVGTLVKIELVEALLFGEVIHLQSQEAGFVAGFEIEEMIGKVMLRRLRSNAEYSQNMEFPQIPDDLEDSEAMLQCL